ncbi:PE family protein [Mycobacterium genavense]|uniref:PE family protein n=1 Tax=Mycobacterium genavense TaxID=36812 RepID=UPI0009FE2956|nr:PE family protein [Mycobacterium genavense]
MSLVSVAPEQLAAAAGDVAAIGSSIEEASATAAAPTTGVAPPASDSVSAQLAELFGGHAVSYQKVSLQATTFHQEFVRTLTNSGASYAETEVAAE